MAEKYWIEDLRQKVTGLFSELGKANRLNEKAFIKAFMEKYPEDYNALVSEWEQKVIKFKKKNRRGHPVTHPIRPEKILSNMYRNYYYKFRKKPGQKSRRKRNIQKFISEMENYGYPAYVAENILNREFKSDMINQKWVTDVSEFKYGVGEDDKKGKLYLSVILDLCDRRPVAFVYSTRNDNRLVFDTFDKAVAANPGATPLLHSDRGYQYTSKAFRRRILAAGMTQSMSRVARCIDNGPMEGFWGLMKREMYYGKKYKTKEELMLAIEKYIDYYTNKRVQRNLGVLTPLEFHEQKLENVA